MHIDHDVKLDFKDVLIRPKRSTLKSRVEVDITRNYKFKHTGNQWTGVPIIASNMDHTGTFSMASALAAHKLLTSVSKFMTKKQWEKFYKTDPKALTSIFISVGVQNNDDIIQLTEILRTLPIEFICLDVANGYSESFVEFVYRIREQFLNKTIMAGNVVTGEMVEQLLLSGADIVKVGIGPGSVCTTRNLTGVGYPQLSAVIECADAAHGLKGLVCADGGCTVPGDIVKAFAAGSDFVMLGGMLAGHEECEGKVIKKGKKQFKRFYGMSSKEAMEKYAGGMAEYRASEGKSVLVPYRGPVNDTLQNILGGLRSACTYVGAQSLKELSKRTTFVRVTQQLNNIFTHEVDSSEV